MKTTYSIYEAKAKLSEIIRQVKRRRRVTITDRGREVARVVPVEKAATFQEDLRELEEAGIITPGSDARPDFRPIARRPGALRRFLAERE